jgi:hypothetical protein
MSGGRRGCARVSQAADAHAPPVHPCGRPRMRVLSTGPYGVLIITCRLLEVDAQRLVVPQEVTPPPARVCVCVCAADHINVCDAPCPRLEQAQTAAAKAPPGTCRQQPRAHTHAGARAQPRSPVCAVPLPVLRAHACLLVVVAAAAGAPWGAPVAAIPLLLARVTRLLLLTFPPGGVSWSHTQSAASVRQLNRTATCGVCVPRVPPLAPQPHA